MSGLTPLTNSPLNRARIRALRKGKPMGLLSKRKTSGKKPTDGFSGGNTTEFNRQPSLKTCVEMGKKFLFGELDLNKDYEKILAECESLQTQIRRLEEETGEVQVRKRGNAKCEKKISWMDLFFLLCICVTMFLFLTRNV